ncbi:uncharacterized protein BX663DRAFT_512392 [Cokeromyces recurvatus]|uniref:uncharacterized protein n=1 Tax=Cokeromyces recurvatus TaxID=90255 RepID=UPI00221FFF04|nr:uncharacterized protein BX663DRAFT_512392 [Cokeromyces recurvatus]KAI7901778.1 hypothetical protein BX663DRAFT_512392 [Cokeromyces recurvatus]
MQRVCSKPNILLKRYTSIRPITCYGLRYSSTTINKDDRHKVYALPFNLSEDTIRQSINFASYANQHSFFAIFEIIKSLFTKKTPEVKKYVTNMQIRKVYLPFWYYDMAISADITPFLTKAGETDETIYQEIRPEQQILGIGFNCYWPGHTWDPVCYLSFRSCLTTCLTELVPFTPNLCKGDIEVLPFSANPLEDLSKHASNALENLEIKSALHKNNVIIIRNAKVLFNAAYPIYLPAYIVQYTNDNQKEGMETQRTVVIGAHNSKPILHYWDSNKTGVEQWINNGSWMNLDLSAQTWNINTETRSMIRQLVERFTKEAVGNFQTKKIDWTDDCIQAYPKYQHQNKAYLAQLFKIWSERSMLQLLEQMGENRMAVGLHPRVDKSNTAPRIRMVPVKELRQNITNDVRHDLNKLEELEPAWYKQYMKKQNGGKL